MYSTATQSNESTSTFIYSNSWFSFLFCLFCLSFYLLFELRLGAFVLHFPSENICLEKKNKSFKTLLQYIITHGFALMLLVEYKQIMARYIHSILVIDLLIIWRMKIAFCVNSHVACGVLTPTGRLHK